MMLNGYHVGQQGIAVRRNDPVWDSVRLHLPFDNNHGLKDVRGHAMTTHGGVSISTAQLKFRDASAYFDGTGWLSTPGTPPEFNSQNYQDFSFRAWIRPTSFSAVMVLLGMRANASVYSPYLLLLDTDAKLKLYVSIGSGWHQNVWSAALTAGAWAFIRGYRIGTTLGVSIDEGTPVTATTSNNNTTISGADLTIGAGEADGSFPFLGYMSDVQFTLSKTGSPFEGSLGGDRSATPLVLPAEPFWTL